MLLKRTPEKVPAGACEQREPLSWEPLEQRVLLSAEAVGAILGDGSVLGILDRDQQDAASDSADLAALIDFLEDSPLPETTAKETASDLPDAIDLDSLSTLAGGNADPIEAGPEAMLTLLSGGETADVAALDADTVGERLEILFVDSRTPYYQQLLDGIASGSSDRNIEVVLLDPESDGIEQISAVLTGHPPVDAVHIISHGNAGMIQLGGSWLSQESLPDYAAAIGGWGEALTAEADLLIYGCNLAANDAGEALIHSLSEITGADVAASDDPTGHQALGGDWELEIRSGDVETSIVVSNQLQAAWSASLATAPQAIDDSYSIDEDTSLDSTNGWALGGWSQRQTLHFDNSAQGEDLTGFPVLVTLDASRVDYNQTQNNGEDLRFVDADGTLLLAYEIESWDESGTSYVWVKVPQIDGSSDSDFIWMYYGNATVPDGQDVTTVWESEYKGVWHLNETSGTHFDATANDHDATPVNGIEQDAVGKIDGADLFDGSNDYLLVTGTDAELQITGDLTLEAWIRMDGYPVNTGLNQDTVIVEFTGSAGDGDSAENYLYSLGLKSNGDVVLGHESSIGIDHFQDMGVTLNLGQWYQLTAVRDATAQDWNLFVDGVSTGSAFSYSTNPNDGSNGDLWIGYDNTPFNGIIDEVRISNTTRSADWIAAEYAASADSFLTYGHAQTVAGVLGNDLDSDGDPLTAVLVTGPTNAASFNLNPDGAFTYTPTAGFSGVDSFTYRATDSGMDSIPGTVTITVNAVNDAPTVSAIGDASVTEEALFSYDVSGNFSDVDSGDTLGYSATLAGGGALPTWLSFNASSGLFSGTPAYGDLGTISIEVTADDGNGGTVADQFDLTVNSTALLVNNVETTDFVQSTSNATPRAIASDDVGNFIVVWESNGQDGDKAGIYARRFYADGSPNGSEFLVSDAVTIGDQAHPTVAMNDDGRFVVAWQTDRDTKDSDGLGVYARLYDETGTEVAGTFLANANDGPPGNETDDQSDPAVAMRGDGTFIVTWTSIGQDGDKAGVFARLYDAAGNEDGNVFQVNTTTDQDQLYPSVATNGAGEFIVAWAGMDPVSGKFTTYVQRFDPNGDPLGGELKVSQFDAEVQTLPSIALSDNGSFIAVWQSRNQDSAGEGIFARRYDSNDTPLGDEFQINATGAGNQTAPSVSLDENGNIVVTWTTEGRDVYIRTFDVLGNAITDDESISTAAGDQAHASVVMTGVGDYIAVWSGEGPGDSDGVFARLYETPEQAPVVDSNGATAGMDHAVTFIEEGTPVLIVAPDATISDVDGSQLQSLSVVISNLLDGADEKLTADTTGTSLTVAYTDGVLTLSGPGPGFEPLTDYQQVLRTVTYQNISTAPHLESRVLHILPLGENGFHGQAAITTVSISNINDAPILDDSRANLWLSTATDITSSSAPGLSDWTAGQMITFGAPDLSLGEDTTSGTFGAGMFNLDPFAGGDARIDGFHYVSSHTTIGSGSGAMTLQPGDLLFSTEDNEVLTSTNTAMITKMDVVLFQPDTPGDYSAGTFTIVIDNGIVDVTGLTLVEQDVRVGDYDLEAGMFLLNIDAGDGDIYWYRPVFLGENQTWGTFDKLIENSGLGISKSINGFDLIETDTVIGGVTLSAGSLLATLEGEDNSVGNLAPIATLPQDIFVLNVTRTGDGTTEGTATHLFDGDDVTLTSNDEIVNAVSLVVNPQMIPIVEDIPDAANTGTPVLSIIGNLANDADGDTPGIVVTAVEEANGTWQYSTDGGSIWQDFGAITESSAVELTTTADDRVRFVPDPGFAGIATLTFHAWDGSDGNSSGTSAVNTTSTGGTTPFSDNSVVATIAVIDINSAPTLGDGTLAAIPRDTADPAGDTVANVFSGQFSDGDLGQVFAGIAVIGNPENAAQGTWQYSLEAGYWFDIGMVDDSSNALAVRAEAMIRFLPAAGYSGTPDPLNVRGLDNTHTDGYTATDAANEFRTTIDTTSSGGGSAISANVADLNTLVDLPPTANVTAGAPYAIAEGESIMFDASDSSDPDGEDLTYEWDIGNDGSFEKSGLTASFTWAELYTAGVTDDGTHQVALRVTDPGFLSDTMVFNLDVTNTAPIITVTGNSAVVTGNNYTLNLSVIDPGDDTISSWMINWGDGAIESIDGAETSATHVYNNEGFTNNILVSATDEDNVDNYIHSDLFAANYGTVSQVDVYHIPGDSGDTPIEFGTNDTLKKAIQPVIGPDGYLYISGESSKNVMRYDAATGAPIDNVVSPAGVFVSGGMGEVGGIVFGPDGNLFVADYTSGSVKQFDGTTGAPLGEFISSGSNGLGHAYGLAFGPDGNLYVGDYDAGNIFVYNGTTGLPVPGSGDAGIFTVSGLSKAEQVAFGPDGCLYINDLTNSYVYRLDVDAGASSIFIDGSVTDLDKPYGLTFGPDGNLYTSNSTDGLILRFDGATGAPIDTYASGFDAPALLAFKPDVQVAVVTTNMAPTITLTPVVTTLSEETDTASAIKVADIVISDDDVGTNVLTLSGADADLFEISGAELRLKAGTSLDFETNSSLDVTVAVDDATVGGTPDDSAGYAVTVTGENDNAPLITSATTASVAENTTAVHRVTVTDADLPGDALSFSIANSGADKDLFSIDAAGNLSFIAAPDFEAPGDADGDNIYVVDVAVFDGLNTTVQSISVTVTGENDNAPLITSATTTSVAENTTAVHRITVTDADLPGDALSFSIANSGADKDLFSIDAAGNLRFIAAPDYELPTDADSDNVYVVDVAVFDGLNTTVQSISVTVTGENDNAPLITSATTTSVTENTTAVHPITVTDADLPGDALSFSIANSGADKDLFSIDAAGNLSFIAAPDFEAPGDADGDNIYVVDVAVFDGLNTTVQSISVTVTGENDNAPLITSATTASVAENTTAVHRVTVTDADLPGDALSFSIANSGADKDLFSIDAAGNLSFIAAPDFEAPGDADGDNIYVVDVAVFDGLNTTVQSINVTVTGENDNAPLITSATTTSVTENTTAVHPITVTDADLPGDALSFSIANSGADKDLFSIDAAGNLRFIAAPDYELPTDADSDNVYAVDVAVFDGLNTTVQGISVTVTGENDNAPLITSATTASVAENTTAVHPITVTDADLPGDALSFSIANSGADKDLFSIDAAGNLRFIAAPDYELPTDADSDNVYVVDVAVFDGLNTTVQSISVTVTGENDNAPLITSATTTSVTENTTAVHRVTVTDADLPGDALSFSIANSGADKDLFSIDAAGNLRFIAAPDYELPTDADSDNVYAVDVAVFDGLNTTVQSISVTVTGENDNAPLITSATTTSVTENTTAVHRVTVTDADLPGDALSFSIANSGADKDLFSIDAAGNLRFIAAPDYELPTDADSDNVYAVDVAVFDGLNTTVQSISVTVTGENDNAPTLDLDPDNSSGAIGGNYNAAYIAGMNIVDADVTVADLDGDSVTIRIIAGNISDGVDEVLQLGATNFPLNSDKISTGVSMGGVSVDIDYTTATQTFLITAVGGGSLTPTEATAVIGDTTYTNSQLLPSGPGSRMFSITVNDGTEESVVATTTINVSGTNAAPTVSLNPVVITLSEETDTTAAAKVAKIVITDDGLGTNTLSLSGADATLFEIVGADLRLKAGTDLDFETDASLDVTVAIDDLTVGGTPDSTASYNVTVMDANDAPTVSAISDISATEDAPFSYDVSAHFSDVDAGDTLSYSATPAGGGALPTWLGFNGTNGVFNGIPANGDVGSINIEVTANDGNGKSISDTFTLTVNNTDDAPLFTATGPFSLNENASVSATVGDVDANDGDAGATDVGVTYAITTNVNPDGDSTNAFSIDSNTGILAVNDVSDLDYESNTSLIITIQADDGIKQTTSDISINLNDINEIPTAGDATFTVDENAANGTLVGAVTASDPDAGADGNLSYAITAGNSNNAFAIDSAGNIMVNDQNELNFETTSSYALTVTVTDGGTPALNDTAAITISVNDLDESPTAGEATPTVDENAANGSPVETSTVTGPDNGVISSEQVIDFGAPGFESMVGFGKPTDDTLETGGEEVSTTGVEEPLNTENSLPITEEGQRHSGRAGSTDSPDDSDALQETINTAVGNSTAEPTVPLKLSVQSVIQAMNPPSPSWKLALGNLEVSSDPLELLTKRGFIRELDELRDSVNDSMRFDKVVVGSTMAVSSGFSVGYVAWLARSGALLSSVLTSLPAWQFVDPLPVLSVVRKKTKGDHDDDESLESMVKKTEEEDSPEG